MKRNPENFDSKGRPLRQEVPWYDNLIKGKEWIN